MKKHISLHYFLNRTEKFQVQFLEEAAEFLYSLDEKARDKIIHYRLFAFWDKTDKTPSADLEKAEKIRKIYFERKNNER